jgi:NADH-quinone oxidoreductase subunit G
VFALGIQNRGQGSVIAPNMGDKLDCEECGQCIDICPVGALTSSSYRYKTRPWEMNHVGTVCTHCGDGCLITVGVRRSENGSEIVRCDNRDRSGLNDDFLCVKGRFGFDFAASPERVTTPLIRRDGKLVAATWNEAISVVAENFQRVLAASGGKAIGVVGSNHTTNEENYLLQKFARQVLGTNNIDHHRTADYPSFARAIASVKAETASTSDVAAAKAVLVIGGDLSEQHPLLAWHVRTAIRQRAAKLYVINSSETKLARKATVKAHIGPGSEAQLAAFLGGDDSAAMRLGASAEELGAVREKVNAESGLVVLFGAEVRGHALDALVAHFAPKGAKFVLLGEYSNSRGAADMGLFPDLGPGYKKIETPGLDLKHTLEAAAHGTVEALWVVGANPAAHMANPAAFTKPFLVVQDLFLTETGAQADVFLPACFAYEKTGTVTNTCGDLQRLKKAGDVSGAKPDFEIILRIAEKMGADVNALVPFRGQTVADEGKSRGVQSGEADRTAVYNAARGVATRTSPLDPTITLEEIAGTVPGYAASAMELATSVAQHTTLVQIDPASVPAHPELVSPVGNGLFASGTMGRYSAALKAVAAEHAKSPETVGAD